MSIRGRVPESEAWRCRYSGIPGAHLTKVRPAVVLSSDIYQTSHPDVILGLITTREIPLLSPTDYKLVEWKEAGLHAPSVFRLYLVTLLQSKVKTIGALSKDDWSEVQHRVRIGISAI